MNYSNETTASLYEQYKFHMQQVADMRYAAAVLQWDEETYMPAKGAPIRARQLATLSETAHRMFTGTDFYQLLKALSERADISEFQQVNVKLNLEDVERQKKLSPSFVRKLTEAVSQSFHQWVYAKEQNDFALFAPQLEKLVLLKKEEAEVRGYDSHPYNAMLYEYEKGSTVKHLDELFDQLHLSLYTLMEEAVSLTDVDNSFLYQHYDKDEQWSWGMFLLKELGFDFEAGRQDISAHPFTINFSAQDVRITTRIDTHDFNNMTWSTLHEMGHALYEQGLPAELYGLPTGEYCSLSIHESQSRLWENCIGRSFAFLEQYYPLLQERFKAQLGDIDILHFYKAINKVQPTLIRTEADELTYHFHIVIRYTIEKELFANTITVRDIPARWNELYRQYLGITVPDDKRGCLQDVHWSHGSFGYFPTYSTGSMYAAQFWNVYQQTHHAIVHTNYTRLLQWLRTEIHSMGRRHSSEALCEKVTGSGLNADLFIHYIRQKNSTFRQ